MANRLPLPTRRGLNERQAADYVGDSLVGFREGVAKGWYPVPRRTTKRKKVWDRESLDVAYDQISGIGDDNEEQAALDAIQ